MVILKEKHYIAKACIQSVCTTCSHMNNARHYYNQELIKPAREPRNSNMADNYYF